MIFCKELDTNFENKEQLFKALKDNKDKIINIKKKSIYTGYNVQNPEDSKQTVSNSQIKLKALDKTASKELFEDQNYYYFVVNTTNILDSHRDLHVTGIWNKSAKEQSGKNYLVDTHSLTIKDVIAYPEDVIIFVATIPFKALNYDYKGDTEALIYKVLKNNIVGKEIKEAIESGKTMQASVKMQYVKIDLAMNSDSEDDKVELMNFNNYKDQIANISDFTEEPSYFFIVKEAKNIHESSLVPFGSNHVTGIINNTNVEPLKDTQQNKDLEEPIKITPKQITSPNLI